MSAADAQAEPTMEEILASIRRIISEDEAAPSSAPPPPTDNSGYNEEVLELTEPVAPMPETVSPDFDFDALPSEYNPEEVPEEVIVEDRWAEPVSESPPVREAYQPPPPMAPPPVYQSPPSFAPDYGLVSDPVAQVTSEVFAKLSPNQLFPGMFASGNTVEALVVEMLKPMLKDWLDANLPRIVEDKVEIEVARIARRSF